MLANNAFTMRMVVTRRIPSDFGPLASVGGQIQIVHGHEVVSETVSGHLVHLVRLETQ